MNKSNIKPLAQQIMTANRLKDGTVVYFTGSRWSTEIHEALVSDDNEGLEKEALKNIENEDLISVELIKVDANKSQLAPLTMREKIRSTGPTIRY